MPIDFYYLEYSGPSCRSVLLLAKAIGVHLNLKTNSLSFETHEIRICEGNSPVFYLKYIFFFFFQLVDKNNFVSVESATRNTDDNGFVLCREVSVNYHQPCSSIITRSRVRSRPIVGYLVGRYAKNDSLYPRDPKRRGMVDQMLYFDIDTLNENVVKCDVRISISFPCIFYVYPSLKARGDFTDSTRQHF